MRVATPFATLIAPAGYGKTTLLARRPKRIRVPSRGWRWTAAKERLVFLRYIAAALDRVEPLAPEVFGALSGPGGRSGRPAYRASARALAGGRRPLVLALDDLHTVDDPTCIDILAELIEYVPAGSQILVASREQPALPLARWRAQGRLHEIGMADLRLDEPDADVLLRRAGVKLTPDQVSELTARTEGWPAGLYLAALSIQVGTPRPARSRRSPARTGSWPSTSAPSSCPASRRPRRGSCCTPRCSTGCPVACVMPSWTPPGVGRTLQALERSNLFLVPLDRRR